MTLHVRPSLSFALTAIAALGLAACGGSDSAPEVLPPPPPPPTPLTGHVMLNAAVKNAVVCLDLNSNGACDASEPASAKTGADGAYTVTLDQGFDVERLKGLSLVALQVPGSVDDGKATIDAADPTKPSTQKPYVLRQAPGKAGQINPLTSLVAAGVAAGMTEQKSRANVVAQLGLTGEAAIDDYQADPSVATTGPVDTARTAALVVASALENGAVLEVGDQNSADTANQGPLRSLVYTGAGNFRFSDFEVLPKADGTAGRLLRDRRVSQANSVAVAEWVLYNQAFLTPEGWRRCDADTPIKAAKGTPSRSVFCNTRVSFSYSVDTSIADVAMADLVTQQQGLPGNVINAGTSTTALVAAVGVAKFPAGSRLQVHTSVNATRPLFINSLNTDGRPQAEATSLEQLIAAKPASAVNLATAGGSLTLGLGSGVQKNLRVAFTGSNDATSGTVQFYECDLNEAQTIASNCVATQTGTYKIETVNGSRVMRFAGHAETVMTTTRLYVEVKASQQLNGVTTGGDWIYQAREAKPGLNVDNLSTNNRISGEGWQALKTQLGL